MTDFRRLLSIIPSRLQTAKSAEIICQKRDEPLILRVEASPFLDCLHSIKSSAKTMTSFLAISGNARCGMGTTAHSDLSVIVCKKLIKDLNNFGEIGLFGRAS